ncbi:DNA-directed RNA polymerase subunit L [Dictyocoela muelleri]|nr:DNA-directed RNA polymerase subunit L [Dictyocoela muelleri]
MDKKLTIIEYKDLPFTIDIKIFKENHTIGNLLSDFLLKDKRCTFSSYKMPHPLTDEIMLRISTDGSIKPKNLLSEVIDKISFEINSLYRKLEEHKINKVD